MGRSARPVDRKAPRPGRSPGSGQDCSGGLLAIAARVLAVAVGEGSECELLVLRGRESGPNLRDENPKQPAVTVRVAVDQARVGAQRLVHRDNLARGGRIQVARCLVRLDRATCLPGNQVVTYAGQLDVDYVSERTRRMLRETDGGRAV